MIVSFCPGRIRLRFRELKNKSLAAFAEGRIRETPGVTRVEINALTGSVLVEYDPLILPAEKLLERGREELAKLNLSLELPESLAFPENEP
jgi:hypothetical protein